MNKTASYTFVNPSYIPATLLAIMAFLLQTYYLGEAAAPYTDEGDHLYAAWLLSQGNVPYLDFAYLHPPGMISALAVGYKLGGSPFILRIAYLALNIAAGVLLFSILCRLFRSSWIALLGCVLYLTHHEFFHHDGRS